MHASPKPLFLQQVYLPWASGLPGSHKLSITKGKKAPFQYEPYNCTHLRTNASTSQVVQMVKSDTGADSMKSDTPVTAVIAAEMSKQPFKQQNLQLL